MASLVVTMFGMTASQHLILTPFCSHFHEVLLQLAIVAKTEQAVVMDTAVVLVDSVAENNVALSEAALVSVVVVVLGSAVAVVGEVVLLAALMDCKVYVVGVPLAVMFAAAAA